MRTIVHLRCPRCLRGYFGEAVDVAVCPACAAAYLASCCIWDLTRHAQPPCQQETHHAKTVCS